MKLKQIIVFILVFTLSISVVGCKKDKEVVDTEVGAEVTKTEDKAPVNENKDKEPVEEGKPMEGNMYLEGFPIVKDPITIRVAAIDWWNAGDYGKMQIPQEYEKLTNIKVEWIHITTTEQLNLMFASGEELPDVFMFLDYDKINELGYDGQLLAVQDLIAEYAPNLQTMLDKEPAARKICTAADGNMYIIPSMYMSPGESLRANTYVNKVWLDDLGMSVPTNMDELYHVLKAFKENDMNGNGDPSDEIPLCLEWDNDLNGIGSLFGPWDVTSATFGPFFARDQKTIISSVQQPGYKEAIQYFHKLYSEGLLDQESFTQDHDKYQSKTSESTERETIIVGASNGYAPPYPALNDGTKRTEADAIYVTVPPLEGPGGKHHFIPVGGGLFTNGYMSADTKYPKEVIRWVDGIADPLRSFEWNGGPRGVFWDINDEGKCFTIQDGSTKDLKKTDYTFVLPIMGIHSEWYANNVELSDDAVRKLEILDSIKPYGDHFVVSNDRAGKVPLNFSSDDESFIMSHYTDIVQYCKNKEAQWIMQGGVEDEWEDFQAQLEKMKIEELQAIYQKALDEWSSK